MLLSAVLLSIFNTFEMYCIYANEFFKFSFIKCI